jgi:hypothetical protein
VEADAEDVDAAEATSAAATRRSIVTRPVAARPSIWRVVAARRGKDLSEVTRRTE